MNAIKREMHTLDADGQILGRLASRIAHLLRGKHKVTWTPHIDGGDAVTVVNAAKIKVTGRKLTQKIYHRHTGYVGHVRSVALGRRMEMEPDKVLFDAVRNMLPANRMRSRIMNRLTISK